MLTIKISNGVWVSIGVIFSLNNLWMAVIGFIWSETLSETGPSMKLVCVVTTEVTNCQKKIVIRICGWFRQCSYLQLHYYYCWQQAKRMEIWFDLQNVSVVSDLQNISPPGSDVNMKQKCTITLGKRRNWDPWAILVFCIFYPQSFRHGALKIWS